MTQPERSSLPKTKQKKRLNEQHFTQPCRYRRNSQLYSAALSNWQGQQQVGGNAHHNNWLNSNAVISEDN